MKPECEAAIRAVAGGAKMTQKDIDGIQARILGSLRSLARTDPKAWASMSAAERMSEAARIAKERYVADTAQAHIRAVQRLAIKTRNDARVAAVAPGANGRIAYMIRNLFHSGEENGGNTSLEKEIMATSGMYLRHLEGEHMLAMQDPTLQEALYKELAGEDSGNAQAKATAKAVREQMAAAYKAQQAAGIAGPGLENYMPQARDWTRMNDVDEWVRKQFDRLRLDAFVNPDGTNMSREQIEKFLRESFATLATNGLNKLDGNGHVADIGSRGPRQLFYKDGASLKAEMDDYGRGSSVAEIVQSHFHRAARDLATATREGHMADTDVLDRARKAASDDMLAAKSAKEKRKVEEDFDKFQRLWNYVRRGSAPGNARWANAFAAIRSVVSSTMLGASNALPDAGMAKVYLNAIGLQTDHLIQDMAVGAVPTKENRFRIGQLGLVAEGAQAEMRRLGEETFGFGGKTAHFLSHNTYVLSSLRLWDRMMRNGIGCAVMRSLGQWLHKMPEDFTQLDAPSLDYLTRKGVTADHWATWRMAELDKGPDGNAPMLTPDAIENIPDEKLEPLARARLGAKASNAAVASEIANLRREAQVKLLAAIETDMQAAGRGFAGMSAREKIGMRYDLNPAGTFAGEMLRTMAMIRQVPIGIFRTHMIDVPKRFDSRAAGWYYRAKFMAATTILGGVGVQLKNIAFGNEPDDMTKPQFAIKAMLASGGLGLYGDALFNPSQEHDEGMVLKLLGPGATFADDLSKLAGSLRDDPSRAMNDKFQSQLLRTVRNNALPFARLWWLRAAFDHLVYQQAQDYINPGYSQRLRQHMENPPNGQGQRFTWWSPGETTPHRAPDFGAAIGQPSANP